MKWKEIRMKIRNKKLLNEEPKNINFAKLSREIGVDYRTIQRAYLGIEKSRKDKPSCWDKYNLIIKEKLTLNCKKRAIYLYLTQKYKINKGESSLYKYCNLNFEEYMKKEKIYVPIIYNYGYKFQVDWKENKKITLKNSRIINFNVLGVVSSYSKKISSGYYSFSNISDNLNALLKSYNIKIRNANQPIEKIRKLKKMMYYLHK